MRYVYILCLSLFLMYACKDGRNVEIKGEILDAAKEMVYLDQINTSGVVTVDSVRTGRRGNFAFRLQVNEPLFYNVRIGKESIPLLAEPDKMIGVEGTFKGLRRNYKVSGSDASSDIQSFNTRLRYTQHMLDSLSKAYQALPQEKQYDKNRNKLTVAWDTIFSRQVRFSKDFILKHALSPVSYYALYQKVNAEEYILYPDTDLHSYQVVASAMKAMYPESQYTKAILRHYDEISKSRKNERLMEFISSMENVLPEIRLPNLIGDTISLSSMKGKYFILDFALLSDNESIGYIRNLQDTYKKFNKKGVAIYQVCLDPKKSRWEEAVKKFNIAWTCVWDQDNENSIAARTWNISTIPSNFIIDPDFQIVGKNLFGRALEDRLNDLLNK